MPDRSRPERNGRRAPIGAAPLSSPPQPLPPAEAGASPAQQAAALEKILRSMFGSLEHGQTDVAIHHNRFRSGSFRPTDPQNIRPTLRPNQDDGSRPRRPFGAGSDR